MNLNNDLIDKIKGVIFGQAIGDAVGLSTELMIKEQIQIFYPNGVKNILI
jgi:ADP-ribosylglycohydrolase